jgi:K+-transporting ATPase ATPase B chain
VTTKPGLAAALPEALKKLHPRHQLRSPVMFVVWVGSLLVTVFAVTEPSVFTIAVAAWLWFTVLFANLAEAVAEGRGKAQAESLRRTKSDAVARLVNGDVVAGTELKIGDLVVVEAGEVVPGDGDVVEGIATVDESAITGESAPVIRATGVRSPEARPCCRTGSSSGSRPGPASPSWTG